MSRCTILIACGWLLFVPPTVSSKKQLSEWEHEGSYDTAKECQKGKESGFDIAQRSSLQGEGLRWAQARCVPTELINFKFK